MPAKAAVPGLLSRLLSRKVLLLYATQLGVSEQGATPSFFTESRTHTCNRECASMRGYSLGTAYEVSLSNARIVAQSRARIRALRK